MGGTTQRPDLHPNVTTALTGVNPRSIMEIKLEETVDVAALRQRLYRLLWSSMALTQSTTKVLERITVFRVLPEDEDVADLTDRLHETFNAYSFITRCKLWQDVDEDSELA